MACYLKLQSRIYTLWITTAPSLKHFFTIKLKKVENTIASALLTNCKVKKQNRPEVFCKKKVFVQISQNSQENTCPIVFFKIKLQA